MVEPIYEEREDTWKYFIKGLKRFIFNDHAYRMVVMWERVSAVWKRCRVLFMKKLLSLISD